jgi:4-diphosphocytidyl-2-C-methyl-D-erythritol kinase
MSGIGEVLNAVAPLPPAWLVLVNPRVEVPTPQVFKARTGDFSPPATWGGALPDAIALAEALKSCHNDLAAPAIGIAPVIGEVLAAIEASTGCLLARMSGSGATCFGLFADATSARAAAALLETAHPAWWVAAAPMVTQPL